MHRIVTLNIGLENNPYLSGHTASAMAEKLLVFFETYHKLSSIVLGTRVDVQIVNPLEDTTRATERTAVVVFEVQGNPHLSDCLKLLACDCTQDAIAVWIDAKHGDAPSENFLVGPMRADWGPFDPGKFEWGTLKDTWGASRQVTEREAA